MLFDVHISRCLHLDYTIGLAGLYIIENDKHCCFYEIQYCCIYEKLYKL